jgi:hypothetical protein
MNALAKWALMGLLSVATGLAIVGCESTQTTDNVINVTPASKTVTNWETVVFTAAAMIGSNATLALPLTWSVSDPARGDIRASGGVTAIYEAKNLSGNNTITVRDQGDNAGIAVVTLVQ